MVGEGMIEFSLVLPVYNQENNLKKNLPKVVKYMKTLGISFEIIIAEDGSQDRSYELAKEFEKRYKCVRVIHSQKRLGRGLALKNAFKMARGKYVGYIDVDGAMKTEYIRDLIRYVKSCDVVTGSRYKRKSLIKRSVTRIIMSLIFNLFVKILFDSKMNDHQCGFKAFRRYVFLFWTSSPGKIIGYGMQKC